MKRGLVIEHGAAGVAGGSVAEAEGAICLQGVITSSTETKAQKPQPHPEHLPQEPSIVVRLLS